MFSNQWSKIAKDPLTRESLVRGVVMRQKAALVFMMGLGELGLAVMP